MEKDLKELKVKLLLIVFFFKKGVWRGRSLHSLWFLVQAKKDALKKQVEVHKEREDKAKVSIPN